MGMCADFAIHDTDGHNPHAHILLTVRPLNENGTWQYKTEKEYLCIKDGEEKGFTASEFKTAQKQGWEKQYRYKVGKKKEYLTSSVAQEKGYERIDKHPKSSRYGRQILMFFPIVPGNLNIRGNRKYGEISLLELRKGRMIWNYNLVLLCPL